MVSALTLLAVAATLRPAITSVGPVLDLIGRDRGLGPGALGLLGAIPLLAFAAISPLVHLLSHRFGATRTVLVAVVILVGGTVLRSLPGPSANLWLGTAIIGSAIAVANVLLPSMVKRDFPTRIALLTGIYTAVMTGCAGLASGVSHPIAEAYGWPVALGGWAALGLLAALCWLLRLRGGAADVDPVSATGPEPTMWGSALAWQVTAFMGLQSTSFYTLVTWLPTIEASTGVDPVHAGWHLFGLQVSGIVCGLIATTFMRGRRDQRRVGVVISALMIVAMTGLLVAPGWILAWVVIGGASTGGALVVALTLVGERARTPRQAGRLSGMVQGGGYLMAAGGPVGAGLLYAATGTWTAPILMVIAIAAIQLVVVTRAGRDAYVPG